MKKISEYEEVLDRIAEGTSIYHFSTTDEDGYSNFDDYEEYVKPNEEDVKVIQELIDNYKYIELGMELHKQISKPCYSSEDEEMIYLDLRRYYESWLAKYED